MDRDTILVVMFLLAVIFCAWVVGYDSGSRRKDE
jgi:hypothetical protein